MSNLYIQCETLPGTHIAVAIREALCVAKRVGIPVGFTHNGVDLLVSEFDTLAEKLAEWNRRFSAKGGA